MEKQTDDQKDDKFYGYTIVAACFIIYMVHAGTGATSAIYLPFLTKYLHFSLSQYGFAISLGTISALICNLFVGPLIKLISARWLLAIASLLKIVSAIVMLYSASIKMIAFTSILAGIIGAFGTIVCVSSIVSEWFIDKRSQMTTIVFGGSGIGAALSQYLAGILLTKMDWRATYYVWIVIYIILGLGINLLFLRTPAQKNQKPYGWEKHLEKNRDKEDEQLVTGLTYKEAIKTSTFKLWWVGILLISMIYTTVRLYGPTYWQEHGFSTVQSATFSSIMALVASFSVMSSGWLIEKIGIKRFLITITSCYLLGAALLVTLPVFTLGLAILIVILVAFSAPSDGIYPSLITPYAFGMKDYARIQAQLMTGYYIASALQPILVGQIVKYTGDLRTAFIESILLGVVGLGLVVLGLKFSRYQPDH